MNINNIELIFYDFEVFKHDWMVVLINTNTNERKYVINDKNELKEFYNKHKNDIWIGYNSRMYDQFILKGLLCNMNPYDISIDLIQNDQKGYYIVKDHAKFPLNNFDVATGFHSLKQLEGFMGSKIKESSVDFNIETKLTKEELDEVLEYCIHDVEQTIEVFNNLKAEFDSQLAMIDVFDLSMEMFNKTKAQLSAHVLGAKERKKFNDEFKLDIPDTLLLSDKYKHIEQWYRDENNMNYKKSQHVEVAGVPHILAWGGIHGAIPSYIGEGEYIMSDIALTQWGN